MKKYEDFLIENFYQLEENINGEFSTLYHKLFEFFSVDVNEEWLGIKGINRKDYDSMKETGKYWALFATIYEKFFSKVDRMKEVDKMREKLLAKFGDRRSQNAVEFFADFRKRELDIIDSGEDLDSMSYMQILYWKN